MENKIILEVAIMLLSGILFGRLVKQIKLPNVTGYLIAGLLLGPSFMNIIPTAMVHGFGVISDLALAFIAFSIGLGFKFTYFKKVGSAPIIIAICESFGAIILVSVIPILCGFDPKFAIMLGAIAAATAPAQTIMVINQYKAKGSLTSMLLSVVAIDDAVALIGFGFAVTIVKTLSTKNTNIALSILSPFYEIGVSLLLGIIFGIGLKLILRYFKKQSNRLPIIIAFTTGIYWCSEMLHGSALMACMALGATIANISSETDEISDIIDEFSPPIYMIFFIISGAGFEVSALKSIGFIGTLYVIVRIIGKMFGAYIGGRITHQEKKISKYLGPTLMPQAGVALGLIVVASKIVPDYSSSIRTTILCSTFIYSIIGPVVAKIALEKAGEIKDTHKGIKKIRKGCHTI
ncbi:cation:proton antiporter [Anaerosacchariphilus polymeriproducens]|uniref:Cation:proton antiporter n=1 Tax=Anaerosacchariphilus polymeriproducens TaxID=1812858 RepID=A0A371AW01_9FIRM|nr:cation:proton antiporter [Anaerosacchariphilus polymeriproducens]RDU23743.1 cation:proton antiporter [Anaerosacchariphilus polymeriproducens]